MLTEYVDEGKHSSIPGRHRFTHSPHHSSTLPISYMNVKGCCNMESLFRALLLGSLVFWFSIEIGASLPESRQDDGLGVTGNCEQQQVQRVIRALKEAGYNILATVLQDPKIKLQQNPHGCTFLAPSDAALSSISLTSRTFVDILSDQLVFERLTYQDLLHLPLGTRLPTPLSVTGLSVTSVSDSKHDFSLNQVAIADPDIYKDTKLTVHGVGCLFGSEAAIQVEPNHSGNLPAGASKLPGSSESTTHGSARPQMLEETAWTQRCARSTDGRRESSWEGDGRRRCISGDDEFATKHRSTLDPAVLPHNIPRFTPRQASSSVSSRSLSFASWLLHILSQLL